MKTCIYCRETNPDLFKGVEHLIPQAFGTFGTGTPTLDCVCDTCNNLFGRTIDQAFARDSWEGVQRYKLGIASSEKRPQTRLKFSVDHEKEMGGFAGAILSGIDSTKGHLMPPYAQFQIFNKKTEKFDTFKKDQIKDIKLDVEVYGVPGTRKTALFAPSEAEYQLLIDELKKIGIDSSKNEKSHPPFMEGKKDDDKVTIPVFIEGTIDSVIKRAVVKILMNFTAKYIGEDEILKPVWDEARNYVRHDGKPILGKLSDKPFWGEETETMRFLSDSFNIVVDNEGPNVIGKLQAYNFYTYDFILVENYNMPGDVGKAARFTKDKPPWFAQKMTILEALKKYLQ